MGAYGSPELYPYKDDDKKKITVPKKNCYISRFSIVLYIILFLVFILFYIAGGKNKASFLAAIFIVANVSVVGNVIGVISCRIKKVKNNFYKESAIVSIIISYIAFWILGIIS